MLDHREGAATVAVHDHRHVAVPAAHRGLIDEQHRAPAAPAALSHQSRPRIDKILDTVPAQPGAAGRGLHRHHLAVRDRPTRQPRGERALERVVVLQEPAVAVVTDHAPPRPHQRHRTPRHLQVADLPGAAVTHPVALQPAVRKAQPQQHGLHAHPERARGVLDHLQHTDLRQMQPNCHNIASHRGPPGS